MARNPKDNIGSCVEERSHLPQSVPPMYVKNDLGHKCYRELGGVYQSYRAKSTVWINDTSNKTGDRASGGY